MAWFIYGTKASIVYENLTSRIEGVGTQEPRFSTDLYAVNSEVARLVADAEAHWHIHPNTASELELAIGRGIYQRVQEEPQKTHFAITYLSGHPLMVAFVICVPRDIYERWMQTWQQFVMASLHLRYVITLDVVGMLPSHVRSSDEFTSIAEWTHQDYLEQRPVYGSGVKLTISPAE